VRRELITCEQHVIKTSLPQKFRRTV